MSWAERIKAFGLMLLGGLRMGGRSERGVRLIEQPNWRMARAGGRGIAPARVSGFFVRPLR